MRRGFQFKRGRLTYDLKKERFETIRLTGRFGDGKLVITVNRNNLVEDSLEAVKNLNHQSASKTRLKVKFVGERIVDIDKSAKEWFGLLSKELVDRSFFEFDINTQNHRISRKPPAINEIQDLYESIGSFWFSDLLRLQCSNGFWSSILQNTIK